MPRTASTMLRARDVAARLNVHRDTVYVWIRDGARTPSGGKVKLRAKAIGGVLRIEEEWLDEFLAAFEPETTGKPTLDAAYLRDARQAVEEIRLTKCV